MTFALGDSVDVRMTKWGDRPHWRFASTYLGEDEHGTWLGIRLYKRIDDVLFRRIVLGLLLVSGLVLVL